jgi:thiosulfate reductase cytochrome b subunit
MMWLIPAILGLAIVVVLVAQGLRELPEIRSFIADYPGDTRPWPDQPVGFPAWLSWQHFLNAFFLVFIARTAWLLRTGRRPIAFWTRNNEGLIRTPGPPRRISLTLWLHLTADALWVVNGVVYTVLLFASGHWMRLVPTDWDVVPNAISVGIQYASLDWPTHDGWVHYNALQLLLYGATVFFAAPLALLTGLRLSPTWRVAPYRRWARLLPEAPIRRLHSIVLFYFVVFTVAHVSLVLATGALRNLNHMYAGRDDENWIGFWIFVAALAAIALAWIALRPGVLKRLAGLTGTVK